MPRELQTLGGAAPRFFPSLQFEVPWPDLSRVWHDVVRAAAARNAVGACAQLRGTLRGLLCQKSFSMMRRLFDALVLPTVSYVSEVWGMKVIAALMHMLVP